MRGLELFLIHCFVEMLDPIIFIPGLVAGFAARSWRGALVGGLVAGALVSGALAFLWATTPEAGLDADFGYFLKEHISAIFPACLGWAFLVFGVRNIWKSGRKATS